MAQSLRSRVSPAAEEVHNRKALRPVSRFGGLAPTASGANSVASALGTPPGATPVWLCQHSIRVQIEPAKPELSTLPGIGTFYFALTINPTIIRLWKIADALESPLSEIVKGMETWAPIEKHD
jgi:hypothetical protein